MLSILKSILFPQGTLSFAELNKLSEISLLKRVMAANVTYFAVASAATTLIHRFAPRWYLRMHRYTEVRSLCEYTTPKPFLRYLCEFGVEFAMMRLAFPRSAWLSSSFKSPLHALVCWRGTWAAVSYLSHLFGTELAIERAPLVQLVRTAPWQNVTLACLPSGNDICTSVATIYAAAMGRGDVPTSRAVFNEMFVYPMRLVIAIAAGYTSGLTNRAWLRMTNVSLWFCIDVFAVRTFLVPYILDRIVPFTAPKSSLPGDPRSKELEPFRQFTEEELQAPPVFSDEAEEQEARMLLMQVDADEMQFVQRFAFDCLWADHVRGSVRSEAARVLRYTQVLSQGATDQGMDTEEMARVASVFGAGDAEFEERGVDEDHRTCAICLSDFSNEEKVIVLKKCRHTFHQACASSWLAQHHSCPLCARDLMRQQSSTGMGEETSSGNMMNEKPEGDEGEGGAAAGAAAAARGNGEQQEQEQEQGNRAGQREDLRARFFRHFSRATLDSKFRDTDLEYGPVQSQYWALGSSKGANAVRDLRNFESGHTWSQTDSDVWLIGVVNLLFVIPQWQHTM